MEQHIKTTALEEPKTLHISKEKYIGRLLPYLDLN